MAHPEEDRYLDALFALVAPMLAVATAQQHKALGLNRKEALPIEDQRSFGKALKYVTTTLGVAPPEAYVRAEQKEAVAFANCIDGRTLVPVFSLGAPLVGDKRQEREQVFELARRAAHLRPERFVRFILPQPQQLGAHHRRGDGARRDDADRQDADRTHGDGDRQDRDGDAARAAAGAARERGLHRAQAARRRRRGPRRQRSSGCRRPI